jgi:hypothetical protein
LAYRLKEGGMTGMYERRAGVANDELVKGNRGLLRPHGNAKDIISNFVYTAIHVVFSSFPRP